MKKNGKKGKHPESLLLAYKRCGTFDLQLRCEELQNKAKEHSHSVIVS